MMSSGQKLLFACLVLILCSPEAHSQYDTLFGVNKTDALGTTVLFDRPDDLRDLYIGFQPIYGEAARTGNSAGYGIDFRYLSRKRLEAGLHFRKSWSAGFHDQSRDDARRNSNTSNKLVPYFFLDAGIVFHLIEKPLTDSVHVPLRPKDRKQAAANREHTRHVWVPAQHLSIWSIRGGLIHWRNTIDAGYALREQGKSNAVVSLPEEFTNQEGFVRPFRVFSSMSSSILYAGVQLSRLRNMAVAFDEYEVVSRDAGFTYYADILVAGSQSLDAARYAGADYALDAVAMRKTGFRAGMDFRHDRDLSYAMGIEFGVRPGPDQVGRYAVLKVSLPVFGRYIRRKPNWHYTPEVQP